MPTLLASYGTLSAYYRLKRKVKYDPATSEGNFCPDEIVAILPCKDSRRKGKVK
jgi:hypothetical protein